MTDASENEEDDEENALIEQALRLGDLRKEVMDRIDGPFAEYGTGNLPMDTQEAFWKHILAFESAEDSTIGERLQKEAGFVPVDPNELRNDDEVHAALWDLLHALASIRVFVSTTDHLSDSELYRLLCYGALESPTSVPPPGSEWNTRVSAHEYGTADDPDGTQTYLRYYADEEMRATWPDEVPPKEDPPYDRDRFLPDAPEYG